MVEPRTPAPTVKFVDDSDSSGSEPRKKMPSAWQHKPPEKVILRPKRVLSSLTFSTWLSIAPLLLPLISIARIFYKLWTTGEDYTDPGMDYYEQRYP